MFNYRIIAYLNDFRDLKKHFLDICVKQRIICLVIQLLIPVSDFIIFINVCRQIQSHLHESMQC